MNRKMAKAARTAAVAVPTLVKGRNVLNPLNPNFLKKLQSIREYSTMLSKCLTSGIGMRMWWLTCTLETCEFR